MSTNNKYKRARDQEPNIEHTEIKRSKTDVCLLDLSDCVLTLIFEYVNSFDLYALSLTCTRFNYLIIAKKLWSIVDIRNNRMCARKFKYFYSNLNDTTSKLMVSGINSNEKCVTNYQFHNLSKITTNLSVLAMEYQLINSNEIQLRHFPAGLKELSLKGTHVEGCISIFHEASVRLKHLHTLILDECNWVGEHSLMALSKFTNLENLSVYNCKNLGDSIAYMSITTRFGFKKLLRIDARLTKMGDQFLKCLNNLRTIREIYLEAPIKQTQTHKNPSYFALRNMLCGRNPSDNLKTQIDKNDVINRVSTYCLEGFRSCDPQKCSFKPEYIKNNETNHDDSMNINPNVIVVSPFVVWPNDQQNDVRVHVLYGNEAPFEFERQTQNEQQENDNFDDCQDDDEILYNVTNYSTNHIPMFHESTVSDDGIRWFTASDTNATDYLGQDSLLFKRPFNNKCKCGRNNKQKTVKTDDWNQPGPSGLNHQQNEQIISIRRFADPRQDLRVVIEHVEPGIQIIVNNQNNNNNAMFQNNLTRLKVFVARNFDQLTDRAMNNLSNIRLELLDVTRTNISADAVKRFLLLNPDCRVVHESACCCEP